MATNFSKPVTTDAYATLLPAVQVTITDLARGLDPATSGVHTNVPTDAIRWVAASNRYEKFDGVAWNALASTYAINVATVVTNANLTGVVTSSGNATAIADAALSIAKTSGLQAALDAKVVSGGALGTPSSGTLDNCSSNTEAAGNSTAKLANTAFVTTADDLKANLAGANTFTGSNQIASLGVGTAASGVAGEIRAIDDITAYYSDSRLKTIISNIPDALAKLCTLNGVIYKGNALAGSFGYDNSREQIGVIAQDVQAVLPQIVVPAPFDIAQNEDGTEYSKSGETYLTVQYEKLIPLLIEAIKELKAEVYALKSAKE